LDDIDPWLAPANVSYSNVDGTHVLNGARAPLPHPDTCQLRAAIAIGN